MVPQAGISARAWEVATADVSLVGNNRMQVVAEPDDLDAGGP
jgi:hypothetical protein